MFKNGGFDGSVPQEEAIPSNDILRDSFVLQCLDDFLHSHEVKAPLISTNSPSTIWFLEKYFSIKVTTLLSMLSVPQFLRNAN